MKRFLIFFFLFSSAFCFAQDDSDTPSPKKSKGAKGFHAGLYAGTFFANKYSAKLYDGWGYNDRGQRNDFANSFMNRRINYDFGGGNGQTDYIAQALGVNHGEWSFDSTDMPQKVRYIPAFIFGLQMNFGLTKKDAIIFNVNAVKLNTTGLFSIVITNPQIGPTQPNYQPIKYFSVTGSEQRLILQAGYRRILGDNDILNFFFEAGPVMNYTKYVKNTAIINGFPIDLSFYYSQPYYTTYHASYLRGTGFGFFSGFGLNLTATVKWTIQFLYNPSFEKINIGETPIATLQHSLGFRAFYNL